MKRIMFSLAVMIAFLLAASNLFAQDQAAAPEYQQGEFWDFKVTEKDFAGQSTVMLGNGDFEVFYSGGQFRPQPLGEKPQGKQALGILLALLNSPPNNEQQYLQFPLSVGKKWGVNYEFQVPIARRTGTRHADNSVTGMEEVTTVAGKFKAFKIERYDTGSPPPVNYVLTYYYSPETKSIVKYHYEIRAQTGAVSGQRDIELIKFGSKRPDFKPPQPQQGQGPG